MRLRLPRIPRRPGPLVLSGLLLGVAFPPFHLVFPSFLALVPFAVWIGGLPGDGEAGGGSDGDGGTGRAEALRGGFFLGLVYYTLVYYWLLTALVFYTSLALLAFLLPVLILSAFLAIGTEGMRLARRRLGWPLWIALPVFWTALEWLRGHLGPVSFPWMQLGDSLATTPRLAGAADLVGSRGLSFWLALVGGLLAEMWLAWRAGRSAGAVEGGSARGRPVPPSSGSGPGAVPGRRLRGLALGLVAALVLPIGYSLARWSTLELRPAARVGVIQPNVPEDLKMQATAATDSGMAAFYALSADSLRGRGDSLQMIVLPETVFDTYIEPVPSRGLPGHPGIARRVQRVARALDARVLYGAIGVKDLGLGREPLVYNSAFLTDTAGYLVGRYDKHLLVPMVERVPFVNPAWLSGFSRYFGGFARGEESPVYRSDGGRFGILICYEDVFSGWSRRYRTEGADYLVNITNDAWFGRETHWWSRSSALWQHPAHLAMRAIENRMGAVRSANTGISEIIDPLGRVSHRTRLFVPAAFAATVWTADGPTVYDRAGDVVGWLSAVAAVAAALVAAWRVRGTAPERP